MALYRIATSGVFLAIKPRETGDRRPPTIMSASRRGQPSLVAVAPRWRISVHSTTPHIDAIRTAAHAAERASQITGTPLARIEVEQAATLVLDDCMFALGQSVGLDTTIEYAAVLWIREHFFPRFTQAIRRFGNRWAIDRANVTGVAAMLGVRAVRYATGQPAIDVEAIRKAAADVERYCQLHARRAARAAAPTCGQDQTLIAGYWCLPTGDGGGA